MSNKKCQPSDKWAKKEHNIPCSRLCHDKKCLKLPGQCRRSHDKERIAAWKAGKGNTPCPFGANCFTAHKYLCLYQHSLDEIFPERPRRAKALENLEDVGAIDLDALASKEHARMSDLRALSSFNKLDKDDEVAIPGMPAFFKMPTTEIMIAPDNHQQRRLREPPNQTHSFDALVTSVEAMTDGSALRLSDVVASCGALRMIFDFMITIYKEPSSAREENPMEPKWLPHRLDLEWHRPGTLYISPWANDPRFKRSWGVGREFERATREFDQSDPVISRSSSHHQVVSYNLGGLRCIVQGEVDAYSCDCGHQLQERLQKVPPRDSFEPVSPRSSRACSARRTSASSPVIMPSVNPKTGRGKGKGRRPSGRQSGLIANFNLLRMDDAGDTGSEYSLGYGSPPGQGADQASRNSKLTVHKAGDTQTPVPMSCLLEIKTRKSDSRMTLESWAGQLYFAGRRQLFSALHRDGVFSPRDWEMKEGLEPWLEDWEKRDSTEAAISRTVALLRTIRAKTAQLVESGDVSLGPEGNGLSLLFGYEDGEGEDEGGGKVPFARLYLRNDGARLVP